MTPAAARAALERHGLLLLQDARLPSLATLVAGAPVKGSWWGHPAGRDIFHIASALDDDGDVTTAKLLGGKVTFVHRKLFAALAAVGAERRQVHTDSGAHATELTTWARFRAATSTRTVTAARGRTELEEAAAALGAARSLLPW